MNDTPTSGTNRKTRYDLNFKRSAVVLRQSSGKSADALASPSDYAAIFEWIEVFYNHVRLHNTLGFQYPVDFETKLN